MFLKMPGALGHWSGNQGGLWSAGGSRICHKRSLEIARPKLVTRAPQGQESCVQDWLLGSYIAITPLLSRKARRSQTRKAGDWSGCKKMHVCSFSSRPHTDTNDPFQSQLGAGYSHPQTHPFPPFQGIWFMFEGF